MQLLTHAQYDRWIYAGMCDYILQFCEDVITYPCRYPHAV